MAPPTTPAPAPKSPLISLLQSVPEEDAIALLEALVSFYTTGAGTATIQPINILGKSLTSISFA